MSRRQPPAQRSGCVLAVLLLDHLAPDAAQVSLRGSVAAHVQPASHTRQQALWPRQLDPRRDPLDRLKSLEPHVERVAWRLARQLTRAPFQRLQGILEAFKAAPLDPRADSYREPPWHAAIMAWARPPGARGGSSISSSEIDPSS